MYTASSRTAALWRHSNLLQAPCFLVAMYCGCFSPSSAHAQERRSGQLEEVVVTAQRREERLMEVPMSITAVSGEQLSDAGIKNVLDLSFSVPSMTILEPGPGMQHISIRGISSTRGSAPLIGTYLDEIPLSALQLDFAAAPDLRVLDLDRVEVLKGPQGTLFGEGAAGGVVRLITKDPELDQFGGEIATELSNTTDGGWSQEVTGVLNVPLAKDVFGIRLAAQYQNASGWIDEAAGISPADPSLGSSSIGRDDINDSEVKHVRVKALLAATENFRVKGMAEIHRNDGGGNNIVNRRPYKDRQFVQAVIRSTPTEYFDDYDLFNVTGSYDFGFAELLSSTSYSETDGNQRFTQVTSEVQPYLEVDSSNVRHTKLTAQELRLASTGQSAFGWVLGGSYKDAELEFVDDGLDLVLFGGTADQLVLTNLGAGVRSRWKTENWATFADVSYAFDNGLQIGGGLRYFEDSRRSSGFLPEVGAVPNLSYDSNKLTYRAYIKYAVSEAANIYASVGTGFRSGNAIGPDAVARGAPPSYNPDETIFYELGTKLAAVGGRVRLEAALYYGEFQNMQEDIGRFINGDLVQYTSNGQDAEIRGAELNVDWAASEQLTLGLSGDVTDTEITYIDPSYDASTLAYGVGDPINLVPKYGLSARSDYRFQWTDAMPGFFRLSFNRKGESHDSERHRFGGIVLTDHAVAPPVSFLNASVGAEWEGWKWNLFGQNLLDEDGFIVATVSGITIQARPRTIGVNVSKSF